MKRRFSVLIAVMAVLFATTPAAADLQTGKMYFDLQDYGRAYKEFAADGSPEAQFLIGLMIMSGQGFKPNIQQALPWLFAAAKRGYHHAEYVVGSLYLTGNGVEQNDKTAFQWFHSSGMKGNPRAQYFVALMYDMGIGTYRDHVKAKKWMDTAAASGYEPALNVIKGAQGK